MSNIREEFANNLNKYMKENGKTQADLVRYMRISSATASDWCNGVKIPRTDKLNTIANWLGIDLSVLLGEKEPEPVDPCFKLVDSLNDKGKKRLIEYANFLLTNPEYKK